MDTYEKLFGTQATDEGNEYDETTQAIAEAMYEELVTYDYVLSEMDRARATGNDKALEMLVRESCDEKVIHINGSNTDYRFNELIYEYGMDDIIDSMKPAAENYYPHNSETLLASDVLDDIVEKIMQELEEF